MTAVKPSPAIAAVILAGGSSSRLGQPKQLVRLVGAETLLERAVHVARIAGCAPVVVVLGANAQAIVPAVDLSGTVVVQNDAWAEGMSSSLRAGIARLAAEPITWGTLAGAVLMTCDQPAVTPEHLRRLTASGGLCCSAYAGRRGVPAYVPGQRFPELLTLVGDAGARALLREAPAIPLAHGELDIDTVADLAQARALFGSTGAD